MKERQTRNGMILVMVECSGADAVAQIVKNIYLC